MTSEERREARYKRRVAARLAKKEKYASCNDFSTVFSYGNLYRAYRRCRKGVSWKASVQRYITNYRTSKARVDLEYYKKLAAEAKHDYERARQLYGSYSDANTDVVLQSFRSKQDDLENDMQLKFNTYSVLSTQLQQAKAKVQERTPAFTLLKGANVPIKPAGPKRMLFVLGMLFLTFLGTIAYILKEDLKAMMKQA